MHVVRDRIDFYLSVDINSVRQQVTTAPECHAYSLVPKASPSTRICYILNS